MPMNNIPGLFFILQQKSDSLYDVESTDATYTVPSTSVSNVDIYHRQTAAVII